MDRRRQLPHPPSGLLGPAVEVASLVSLMLGITCLLMLGAMVWVATPESIRLFPLSSGTSFVRGGQALVDAAPSAAREFFSALELIAAGAAGLLLVCRSRQRPGAEEQ